MIRFRISGYVFRISEPVVLERVEILSLIEQFQFNFLDDNRWQFILSGLKNTIIITFFAVLLGIFLGFVIAIVRSTHDKTGKLKILNVICRVYLTVIRGTPTMVQLLIVFYVIFATIDPGKIVVAIIAFGMNSAAYVAEIVRSGIMSIDQGQFEATSISGYIGLMDLTRGGDIIRSQTYSALFPLLVVAAIYLVIVCFLTYLVGRLERRLRTNERK